MKVHICYIRNSAISVKQIVEKSQPVKQIVEKSQPVKQIVEKSQPVKQIVEKSQPVKQIVEKSQEIEIVELDDDFIYEKYKNASTGYFNNRHKWIKY
jgi:hypothetical protein